MAGTALRALTKTTASPVYLIHYVTNLCNARCAHCFIDFDHPENTPRYMGPDMTLAEIERITRGFPPNTLLNVNLTGGEPFIRKDLPDIVRAYVDNAGVGSVQITSNGYFTERVQANVARILADNPRLWLVVSLSIDGVENAHDSNRQVPGLYDRTLETYRSLTRLGHDRLSVNINVTISRSNQDQVEEIYRTLVDREGVHSITSTAVRGRPMDPGTRDVDGSRYRALNRLIEAGIRSGELENLSGSWRAHFVNAKNSISRRIVESTQATDRFHSYCYAGRLIAVLHNNGDVYLCELLDRQLGNIRDHGYDWAALWKSPQAKVHRDFVWDTKCRCTHECFWTVNILFNPRYVPELLVRGGASTIRSLLGKPRRRLAKDG